MTHFKFEGEIDNISARQLEFVSEVLEKLGYKEETKETVVKIENVGKAGDNYVADVKRIIVEKDGKPFKMIAKVAPAQPILREKMNTHILFHNEHVMYTDILPKFSELEKNEGLLDSERLKYSICYGSIEEAPNEIILFEDLNESNFFMLDRFVSLTNDAVKLVLKDFAKLHALSYVLKYKEPETFTTLSNKLVNMYALMDQVPEMKIFMLSLENEILTILEDEKHKKVVKGTVSQLNHFSNKNNVADLKSKFSVIQQGDSWTNNIMFKFEENKPVECCMIDYQISRVSSPVTDIHYLIFNCTDYETRSKNYTDWMDYYHEQLDKCLSKFGFKANFIYPRDQFDVELRRYGKHSFCLSALLATVLTRGNEEAAKMKEIIGKNEDSEQAMEEGKISAASKETVAKFKKRMEGLIDSYLEYGYL